MKLPKEFEHLENPIKLLKCIKTEKRKFKITGNSIRSIRLSLDFFEKEVLNRIIENESEVIGKIMKLYKKFKLDDGEGDLNGLSVDETGTVIGSFTNGRSFGLAQIAMATFTNNQGLESDGGNCFVQTSNSGDPIVGQASTGGKGSIQASSLEMSNVDLSRSLTQLIVIQRGYQANSKTITTADEMLNTLLQLK